MAQSPVHDLDKFEDFIKAINTGEILDHLVKVIANLDFKVFEYDGFDAVTLRDAFFHKAKALNAEQPVRPLAELCAIGYSRGNITNAGIAKTTTAGKNRIEELIKAFGIPKRDKNAGKSGKSLTKETLTFVRATAVFPYIVCELLHRGPAQGITPKHVNDPHHWGVNQLPAVMRFTNFPAVVLSITDEKTSTTLMMAWAAWQHCFLLAILPANERVNINLEYMQKQHDMLSQNATITVDASAKWVNRWEILKGGKISSHVLKTALAYAKFYNPASNGENLLSIAETF